jgi:predicted dehydrogenase
LFKFNKDKIRIGIVGPGYWGKKWIKNIINHPNYDISWIVYNTVLKSDIGQHQCFLNIKDAMSQEIPDIVLVTAPAHSHLKLSLEVLQYVDSIIISKPIGVSKDETLKLIKFCKENSKNIFVDHTYLFHPKIQEIKELVDSNSLGEIIKIESTRLNYLDINEKNLSVLRYLGVHDISILDFLLLEKPNYIFYKSKSINNAEIHIDYKNNISANILIGYNHTKKIRFIKVEGSKKTITWDEFSTDIEPIYLELNHIRDVMLYNVKPINGYDHIERVYNIVFKLEDL